MPSALGLWFVQHRWILDGAGKPIFTDFVAIWTSGRLALQGMALSAYDGHLLHAAEITSIGHGFTGALGWPYPPTFFFVAAALGSLPYLPAFAIWSFVTLALYAANIAAIAKSPHAILLACAAPWVAADLTIGQNGFLTAALIGTILLTTKKRPVLSGILLGLLTYKPQFGLLFPLALVAGGHWRVLVSASVMAVVLLILSGSVFGFATFSAFLHNLPQTTQTLLVNGSVGWNKIQSVYAATRWMGGSDILARILQSALSLACLAGTFLLWRSDVPFSLKAAGLAGATLLVTPYVFFYDFPMLAVAIAFLYRHRPFDTTEYASLSAAMVCTLVFVIFTVPAGVLSAALVVAMVLRRWTKVRGAVPITHVALQHG